jgi:uncharacterized protein
MIELRQSGNEIAFSVRVTPRASRDAIEGEWQGALRVRLSAPPVDDRANEALCRFLAACLNIAPSAVRIVAGERSRMKRVQVRGVSAERVRGLSSPTQP